MSTTPRKLSLEEILETSTVFYNDEELEQKFDDLVRKKAKSIIEYVREAKPQISKEVVIKFLREQPDGLKRILSILHLSEEKFKRIVTLLRKLDGTLDTEWTASRIDEEVKKNNEFAERMANLFIDGKNNPLLLKSLPRFYRERLDLTTLKEYANEEQLMAKLKDRYMGTYSNWKGDAVENLIRKKLDEIGVNYEKGRAGLVDVTVDFAVPNLQNPYVIIMSSFQETTGSGQTVKARDMLKCYEAIQHRNINRGENRAFVNFVDGGGWLARKKDLKRLVDGCHYFLNINNLNMLKQIISKHVPRLM